MKSSVFSDARFFGSRNFFREKCDDHAQKTQNSASASQGEQYGRAAVVQVDGKRQETNGNPTLTKKLLVKKFGKIYLLSVMLFFPNSRNSRSPDPREKLFGFSDPAIKKFPNRQFSLFTKNSCCDIIFEMNKLLLSRSADGHRHRRRRSARKNGVYGAPRPGESENIRYGAFECGSRNEQYEKTDRFGMGYDGKTVLRRSVFV